MKLSITAELLEREVEIDGEIRAVYGLASLHTNPRRIGLGRLIMEWSEDMAKKNGKYCVVGFALPETFKNFDAKCGWVNSGEYEGRVLTTSMPVKHIVVNERW